MGKRESSLVGVAEETGGQGFCGSGVGGGGVWDVSGYSAG